MNEEENIDKEVIESEIADSEAFDNQEAEQEEINTQEFVDEQVVVKKGSFLAPLAFILSLAALGLSGYMFYLQQNKTVEPTQKDNSVEITKSIAALENKSTSQFAKLNKLIVKSQQENQQLGSQLKALEETAMQVSGTPTNEASEIPTQEAEPFDDSSINQQLSDLQNKIIEQDKLIEQLQSSLKSSSSQNSQSIQQLQLLSTDLKSQIDQQVKSSPTQTPQVDTGKSIARSLLQEAYVQLNINGNVDKAQGLLNKTIGKLNELTGLKYGHLATALEGVSLQLTRIVNPNEDFPTVNKINLLSSQTKKLTFVNAEEVKDEEKKSSWYDNLITIKKIDDSQQNTLSISEQTTIQNVIDDHYQVLKMALMSKNKEMWINEIGQIQGLLDKYFPESSQEIKSALNAFKEADINPKLPDLDKYLQQFNAINLANENE